MDMVSLTIYKQNKKGKENGLNNDHNRLKLSTTEAFSNLVSAI